MEAQILSAAEKDLTQTQIESFIIGIFQGCLNLNIMIYGFYYLPGKGIYTVAPRQELEKLNNTNIEDCDFMKCVEHMDLFWLADWTNPAAPRLNRMAKKS